MKIFTPTFKKHIRKILLDERDYKRFYRQALRSMERIVAVRLGKHVDKGADERLLKEIAGDDVTLYVAIKHKWQDCLEEKVADDMEEKVKEHFAVCWRDDDCPQAEKTFGVCVAA